MVDPATGLVIFAITGLGGVVTYSAFHYAEKAGPELKATDLLPAPFPHPPLPRLLYNKELMEALRKR